MSDIKVDDVLEAYNGLIGNWDIEEIISEIKNSWDREAMTDLFRISASLVTKLESQKAITELAVKGFKEVLKDAPWETDSYTVAFKTLSEIERLQNEQT